MLSTTTERSEMDELFKLFLSQMKRICADRRVMECRSRFISVFFICVHSRSSVVEYLFSRFLRQPLRRREGFLGFVFFALAERLGLGGGLAGFSETITSILLRNGVMPSAPVWRVFSAIVGAAAVQP